MKYIATLIVFFFLLSCNKNKPNKIDFKYPVTYKDSVIDEYFGTKITAPYTWLEDNNSKETKTWIKSQNELTFSYLNKIPFRDSIKRRLESILNYDRIYTPTKEGKYYYFYKFSGIQNLAVLYRSKKLNKDEEVFINPNTFSKDGTISISKESFSKDGSLMAYQISEKGSDWKKIVVIDTKTKKQVGDTLFNIFDSRISWIGNSGFYYSTFDKPKGGSKISVSTQYDKLFFHKLNNSQKDDQLIFDGKDKKIRYLKAFVTEDERFLHIKAAESSTGNGLYIKDLYKENSTILEVVKSFDNKITIIDNQDSRLLISTNYNAPKNRLIEVDASAPKVENWKDVIPETENVLSVSKGGGYLFASYIVDVKSKVIQYDYNGKKIRQVELPTVGTSYDFSAKKDAKYLFYTFNSFTYPSTIFKYDLEKGISKLFKKPNVDFSPEDFVTKQVFFKSKDGTRIPMFIVHKKGIKLNGKNPTYMYGYGGFGAILKPLFYIEKIVWIEAGGIYVHTNLRGGGEYGEEWHKEGMKMNKQNTFDDFIAAAEYLFKEKYTSSDYLAIAGRSGGGLLVGATMTQRPKLAKVALPSVGVLDMLKYHKYSVGAASWATEYGTADESEEMFKYLYNYSPLHRIKKGIDYPATLIMTADHDDRVLPTHSFKFAAKLQANSNSNNPLMIRIETNSGHGAGTPMSKLIQQVADSYAFAWYNMGVNPYKK